MTDPKRLVEEGELGATLLASASTDSPSRHARERVALAMGLVAATTVVGAGGTAAGATGAAAGAGAGAGAGVGVAKAAGVGLLSKLLIGGLVTVVAAGGVVGAQRALSSPSKQPAPLSPATALARPALTPTPSATPTELAAAPAPIDVAAPKASALTTATSSARPLSGVRPTSSDDAPTDSESLLGRELRSLDSARGALARGDAPAALSALDRHERAFPHGALATEATVLRVEALLAAGDTNAALRLASRVLARDPAGPHARRMQSIVDGHP